MQKVVLCGFSRTLFGATDLSLTHMEVLVAVVDDAALWSACPNETQTLKNNTQVTCGSVLLNTKIRAGV